MISTWKPLGDDQQTTSRPLEDHQQATTRPLPQPLKISAVLHASLMLFFQHHNYTSPHLATIPSNPPIQNSSKTSWISNKFFRIHHNTEKRNIFLFAPAGTSSHRIQILLKSLNPFRLAEEFPESIRSSDKLFRYGDFFLKKLLWGPRRPNIRNFCYNYP